MRGLAWAAAGLLAGGVLPAVAAPYQVRLDAAVCRAAPAAVVRGLGADWGAVAGYAEACPVRGPDGRVALSVVVVRIDRMQRDRFFAAQPDLALPLPVVLDADVRAVGRLAEGFPVDLPGALRVSFVDWRGGWPRRIEQFEGFATALPPHSLSALLWDRRKRRYQGAP